MTGKKPVSDDQLGQMTRRWRHLESFVLAGTRDYDLTMAGLQVLSDGRFDSLISDLLKVKDPSKIDRAKFQRLLGLEAAATTFGCGKSFVGDDVFPVTVSKKPWVEWIAATGIDPLEINSDFNETNFRLGRVDDGDYDLVYYHSGGNSSIEKYSAVLKEHGLERPGVEHFLAFAAKFPEEQQKFDIVAILLRLWRDREGNMRAPCLHKNGNKRNLSLYYTYYGLVSSSRFLAIRPRK